jgi:hypothetical protein
MRKDRVVTKKPSEGKCIWIENFESATIDIGESLLRASKTSVPDTISQHFKNQMFIILTHHKCNLSRIKSPFYIFVKPENISGLMDITRLEIKKADLGCCMPRPDVRINNSDLLRLLPQNLAEAITWKTKISHCI